MSGNVTQDDDTLDGNNYLGVLVLTAPKKENLPPSLLWCTSELVYCLSPGNPLSVIDGYFELITIGYSVGLAPRDPNYQLSFSV
jgi:hypothetical protein